LNGYQIRFSLFGASKFLRERMAFFLTDYYEAKAPQPRFYYIEHMNTELQGKTTNKPMRDYQSKLYIFFREPMNRKVHVMNKVTTPSSKVRSFIPEDLPIPQFPNMPTSYKSYL
jgi:hypothetical protein